jgi:phosphotransferase family enzyme
MIEAAATDARAALFERLGIHEPLRVQPIGHGRNSRVERVSNDRGEWILKRYFAAGPNSHDRLGAEYAFLEYLSAHHVSHVAWPIAADRDAHLAVYTKLEGQRVTGVTDDHIRQAAAFICAINQHAGSAQARALPRAADACASWGDHLALARTRVAQLVNLPAESDIEHEAHAWALDCLAPAWYAIEASLAGHASAAAPVTPILSPSDFGLHNALADGKTLSFVDFEYAGWDDAAKLACDFICQPEIPVDHAQGQLFVDLLAQHLVPRRALVERVALLLPAHRIKWCCILLNEFRAEHRARRLHAGASPDGMLAAQLDKARHYFAQHFSNIQE